MGTHPIFESDFDCLTECSAESPESLPALPSDRSPPTTRTTTKSWSELSPGSLLFFTTELPDLPSRTSSGNRRPTSQRSNPRKKKMMNKHSAFSILEFALFIAVYNCIFHDSGIHSSFSYKKIK